MASFDRISCLARMCAVTTVTLSVSACFGSAASEENELTSDSEAALAGCAKTIKFAGLTFLAPKTWDKSLDPGGDVARIGVAIQPSNLTVTRNFYGDIDSLNNAKCSNYSADPNGKVDVIDTLEDGPLPVGQTTAEHRRWRFHCSSDAVAPWTEIHNAWLLKEQRIAIYEEASRPQNLSVVTTAGTDGKSPAATTLCKADSLKELAFGSLTFRVPEDWVMQKVAAKKTAYIGRPSSSVDGMNLQVIKDFEGTIADVRDEVLCHVNEFTQSTSDKELIERGRLPVGGYVATYRRWKVTCWDSSTEYHRAWLLPNEHMAIVEQNATDKNLPVVTYAKVN